MITPSFTHAARRGRHHILLWACTLLALPVAHAAPREYSVAPIPDWVQRISPAEPTNLPSSQVSQGVYYLLSDNQTKVDAQDKTVYRHLATKALNERGVESVAHVEIRFDPSYQTLALHMLQVRRGTQIIPKLASAQVKLLQRERELEYLIFDGAKTANVFLDDVRVGDVVEYAYSLRGSNPVFGNRHSGRVDLQGGVPVQHIHSRLLWPRGRPLELRNRNGAAAAVVTERGTHLDHVWQVRNAQPLLVEEDAPSWFDPYPSVQWGEFRDWQSVARWALPYYRVPTQLSAGLQAEADRIAKANASPGERLLAALRFVQREIRYMGVEIGPGSHAPSAPHVVLERRFGDCKDKSLLTMTLLQALGIEARATLVHTSTRRGIRELAPTPYAFNHVIVRATLGNQHYWIDPTRTQQKGDLAHLYQPDYEAALVIDDNSRDLVAMTGSRPSAERKVHTLYDSQAGTDQPVRYTVTSTLLGSAADGMRNTLGSENREDLQKRYLNFYARYHPELTVASPMTVQDDESDNRLTITEHYLIPNFWRRAEERKRLEALIAVPEVDQYLRRPQQSIRVGPLALAHPVNLTHITEVRLPESWNLRTENTRVEDASFEFERKRTEKNRVLTLVDSFRSRTDHVAPAETARYAASLERARDASDLVLYRNDGGPATPKLSGMDRFNWTIALLSLLLLTGMVWVALKFYRRDPPARPAAVFSSNLEGIGGWLLLPALGVIAGPIRLVYDMFSLVPSYAADNWAALTTAGSATYHAMWAPVLLFELAANLAYLVASLLLVVMFFQKRRGVPKLFIGVLVFALAIRVIDLALMHTIPGLEKNITSKDWGELTRGLFALAVWGSYFMVSERVRATFVRAHPSRKEPVPFEPTQPSTLQPA